MTGLDHSSSGALIYEVQAVKAMLDAAEKDLDRVRVLEDDLHPWLAVAALGVERFLKLVLGFARLDQHGKWPGQEIRELSHMIVKLETECRTIVRTQVSRAQSPVYVRSLLADVDNDPWIGPLLAVLEGFADQGRYENLDGIAGQIPKNTPKAKFEGLEFAIVNTNPTPHASSLDELLLHRNTTIRQSLQRLRKLYAYAMAHAVLGSEGKRFGLEFCA